MSVWLCERVARLKISRTIGLDRPVRAESPMLASETADCSLDIGLLSWGKRTRNALFTPLSRSDFAVRAHTMLLFAATSA